MSGGLIKPVPPEKNLETLREAFDFEDTAQVRKFIAPLISSGEAKIIDEPRAWFVEKILEG